MRVEGGADIGLSSDSEAKLILSAPRAEDALLPRRRFLRDDVAEHVEGVEAYPM